ncbi:MAG: hypothetical protein JWL97_2655 [Gemmatimonadales bacterium]|nr:hypothetical protein [Gemmatimonadales bacterium]
MRDVFIARLLGLAAADPRIMLLTGDLGFGVLDQFRAQLPRQFLNVGVAEQNMTGVATGLALNGRIVFTYSIANFPTLRCLEQIRNDSAYHEASVKVVAIGGGFSYGPLGMSHHATEDLSILRALPITVVAPGDDWEAGEATAAVAALPGTCYLRLDKSSAGDTSRPAEQFTIGKARILREGADLTFISIGGILSAVLEANERLADLKIASRVISMHTIKPIDRGAILDAARTTGGILTVEEHTIDGGLGGAVAEVCMDAGIYPQAFKRMALPTEFSSIVGSQEYLRAHYRLDPSSIVDTALQLLRTSPASDNHSGRRYTVPSSNL